MDDPGWAWPYWKFGLSKDDLFSTLHDRYNTFASSIQDPEAFHHDVYEISHDASTADEFHRLLADRREQRLRELNDSLESAALEIIANPTLIGTEQWQHALQLFRSKSFDSLVRYFASYLPEDHSWHKPYSGSPSSASSISDIISASSSIDDSLVDSHPSLFDDDAYSDNRKPIVLTHEPLPISSSSIRPQLPPSPRSMTMCSEESSTADDVAHCTYVFNTLTPARTLSFSESESDRFPLRDSGCCVHHDADALRPCCDAESPSTSVSSYEILEMKEEDEEELVEEAKTNDDQPEVARTPTDESETPTPKPEQLSGPSFFDKMPSPIRRRHRSLSPSRHHRKSQPHTHTNSHHHHSAKQQLQRRACSPATLIMNRRKHSPGESAARIQKPLPDPIRSRPSGRRWAEC